MSTIHLPGIALVTGASKGIGRGICIAFAVSGVSGLVLAGRNQADLEISANEAKTKATNPKFEVLTVTGDISVEADIIDLISKSVSKFGRLDYAVNNAGFIAQKLKLFAEVSTEELDTVTNTNQRGTFLSTREEIKVMLKQDRKNVQGLTATVPAFERGSIVNISSSASIRPMAMASSYNPTTFARNGITKSAAMDYAGEGIRVNAVLAGYTVTEGFKAHPDGTPETAEALIAQNPMKRLAMPADVADAVIFLSSPLARFITGETILVDGGQSI